MSHASLVNAFAGDAAAWKKDSRLSLSGTSETALFFFLNKQKEVKELVFTSLFCRPLKINAADFTANFTCKRRFFNSNFPLV